MESLAVVLQPHKEIIGSVASIVTIGQFFSGVPICYDIYKNNSTKGKSATPFVGGTIMGFLVLKYALILHDKPMFQVNVMAILLNLLYTLWFIYYSSAKWEEVYKQALYGTGLLVAIYAYAGMESPANLEFRYGFLTTILSLLLLGSPLMEIKDMINNEDASAIPFPIVFMATWVTLLWLLYGIILRNIFMEIQNIIGLILCIVQLVLYYKYPKPSGKKEKKRN